MLFKYFRAPESEMLHLKPLMEECSLCGVQGRVFDLDAAEGTLWPDSERQSKVGCFNCLRAGRFGFGHDTAAGYLHEGRLIATEKEPRRTFVVASDGIVRTGASVQPKVAFSATQEAILDLWRTPCFSTWNEVAWPIHCQEFMTFLGEWKPARFTSRDQFLQMTDRTFWVLWPPNEPAPSDWSVNYCAFGCSVCDRLTGIVDHS